MKTPVNVVALRRAAVVAQELHLQLAIRPDGVMIFLKPDERSSSEVLAR